MMNNRTYNYSVFDASPSEFAEFATHAPKVTMRAPSFLLEDLETGRKIQMKDLWKSDVVVMEFESST